MKIYPVFSILALSLVGCNSQVKSHDTTSDMVRVEEVFHTPLKWRASAPLILPSPNESHDNIVSVKDPSIVRYEGKWHVFATTANTDAKWNMEYVSFENWEDAPTAKPYYFDQVPGLDGYHCAPQVFYYAPQKKWYMIYQSQHPQYSTTNDISDPTSWSEPKNFFDTYNFDELRLDYWIICDDTYAYLFCTGDDGNVYRSQTTKEDFPKGMTPFETVISGSRNDVFEAGMTYKIKGTNKYLTLVEAIGPARYYRAWIADDLGGEWTEIEGANTWKNPFAGMNNVTFKEGVTPWTADISHGELIREGYDEIPVIDPNHMEFLFQGYDPDKNTPEYHMLPYRLGLLTQEK